MKILNLGAGGFIGGHLTSRLLAEGHEVVGVDTHTDKVRDDLEHPRLTFIEADIRDLSFELDPLVRDCDLVLDLIAYANPGLYVRIPLEVFRLNFMENLKIVEACAAHGKRLVQFSSSEVYGKTPVSFLGEQLPDPENPDYATFHEDESHFILGPVGKHRWIYSCAKQLLERVLHAYGLENRLTYSIIRPFNFIGPRIDYLPTETDGIPRVFSHFMDALLHGTSMKLVDGGRHQRSYTYIDDAIECIYRIVENREGVCDQQIFNIGSADNEVSILELAELMREVYAEEFMEPEGRLPDIEEVSAEAFYGPGYEDSDRRIPDTTKVEKLLGWHATTGLRQMLVKTMAYYVSGHQAPTTTG